MNNLFNLIAQNFGTVNMPAGYKGKGVTGGGFTNLLSNALKTLIIIAGIYAVFNFVLAGYGYLSAGGDSKAIAMASAKIWQSIIGLLVAASAIMLAGIIGNIIFGDPGALINPTIYTP